MERAVRSQRRLLAILAMVLITMTGIAPVFAGAFQESQPTTVGVSGGAVGSGEPAVAEGYTLSLRRGVFDPGGYVNLHHHPGALVLWIESGELTYIVSEGTAILTRAEANGTPVPAEELGPGSETILKPGDAIFEEGVMHISRNDGTEPVVLWISALASTDQPLTVFEEATPAP